MPAPDYQRELDAAVAAARRAGAHIRRHAGNAAGVRQKGVHDLVTDVDEAAQRLIVGDLGAACPDIAVLAEEGTSDADLRARRGDTEGARWIIDPIDGTTNFTRGLAPYCVSIALEDRGDLVLGVVYEITADEMFAAVRGRGLTLNGAPAEVSGTDTLARSLVTTGFPFRHFWYEDEYLDVLRQFMRTTLGVRRPGSAAADLAYVACGRCDAFFEAGLAPWDLAAGVVLVREGGGLVTDLEGRDTLPFSGQILAANEPIHALMLAQTDALGAAYAAGLRARADDEGE
jgi:myo-inositol-1(or 4)-monophosphatase